MNDCEETDSQTYYDYIEFDETTDSLNGAFLGTGTPASLGLRCSSLTSSQGSPSLSGVVSSISGVAAIFRGATSSGGAGGSNASQGGSHHHSRKRSSLTSGSGGAGARYLYGGVRHFLRRALKEVQFSGSHTIDEVTASPHATRPSNLESLCEATQLTKQDVKSFYRAYKQECPNGMASRENFREVLNKFFPQGEGSQYASYIFNAFDTERKGFVTFEVNRRLHSAKHYTIFFSQNTQDFVKALSMLSRGSAADRLRWAFAVYDVDGDGSISRKELRDVIVAVHRLAGYKLACASQSSTYGTNNSGHTSSLTPQTAPQRGRSSKRNPAPSPKHTSNENESHHQHGHSQTRDEEVIERHADAVFKKLDLNQDGLITVDVFVEACLQDSTVIESLNQLGLQT